MPSLGLGTQIGNASGGFLDSDALAYISKAGIAAGTLTPTSYDAASTFNGTNQYLSVASNSTLTVTGSSFSLGFWLNPAASSTYCIVGKTASTDTREFQVFCNSGSISFAVFPDGTFANKKEVTSAVVALNTWTFVTCVYDSGTGTISVYLNAGTPASVASVPAITQTNTNPFQLGVFTSSLYYFSGKIGAVNFWKRALTSSEITSLYNNGEGLPYSALDSSLKTSLVSWWALNETSGNRADSHGSNTLTNNNTVGTGSGPVVLTRASASSLISQFVRGIKALGLWNSMVCWPLRSSQNASSTLTAKSLGGLGTYDGTLVNSSSSAWTSSGLNLTGANAGSYFSAGFSDTTTPNLITISRYISGNGTVSWVQKSGTSYNATNIANLGNYNFQGEQFLWGTSSSQASYTTASGLGTTYCLLYEGYVASGVKMFDGINESTQVLSGSPTIPANILYLAGRYSDGVGSNSQHAFAMVSNMEISTAKRNSLYALYSSTLGQGLGLP